MKVNPKQKSPPVGGRAVDDRRLIDQSRHRAAAVRPRHQARAVELAAMAFGFSIRSSVKVPHTTSQGGSGPGPLQDPLRGLDVHPLDHLVLEPFRTAVERWQKAR